MTDLDKARVWAECTAGLAHLKSEEIQAAVDVIQSLPNAWVDVEKVREVINGQLSVYTRGTVSHYIAEEITRNLESLLTPESSIKPSEVPANEPWLIEANGQKAIGTRYKGDAHTPWSVASLDGSFAGDYNDNEVTLIHKLVHEPPALPEGMRLADHKEYGRVVVSPKDDRNGDYRVFCSQDQTEYGDNWWYAHKSDLTFLDGDQHV